MFRRFFIGIGVIISLLGMSGCIENAIAPPKPKGILFLGHTYRWHTASNRVDERIEELDLDRYEQIWLGGDICSETTYERATLNYLDELFDLDASTTHWALGNHDLRNGNWEWIEAATGRKLHYAHNEGGLTLLVTNTYYRPAEHCEELADQLDMIRKVCDTIQHASHLIMLSHLVTWAQAEEGSGAETAGNVDASWWRYQCDHFSNFNSLIYPLLKEVQQRGVQVVLIAGDAGKMDKYYEYKTPEGIWFLASGINNSYEKDDALRKQLPKDRLLYLEYDRESKSLMWEFPILDSLVSQHAL